MSRQAVDTLVSQARSERRIYASTNEVRGIALAAAIRYDVIRVGVAGEEYLSDAIAVLRDE